MAAPVLVFRTPGGLHRHPAGDGDRFADSSDICAQTCVWLWRYGEFERCHCLSWLARLGTPHVCQRIESLLGARFLRSHHVDRNPLLGENLWLAGHHLEGAVAPDDADAVLLRFCVRLY